MLFASIREIIMDTARAAAAFILMYNIIEQNKSRKRKVRWWTNKLFRQRTQYGNKLLQNMTFELVEDTVKNFTRMSLTDFHLLVLMIEPMVKKKDTTFREAITVRERLAITLRFLATGDSYTSLQYLFRVSKQAISRIVPEVCDAITDALKDYVKIPSSEKEWLAISQEFEKKWNFPHAIGAIDGKHIMLHAPMNSGAKYFFNIILFALVDADYNFFYVDVDCQERMSDGDVFKNTELFKKLEEKTLKIPPPSILQVPYTVELPYYILGDKAFTLNDYTMEPFEGTPDSGSIECVFNYRLSRAHRVVENAFGILSSVFRVLKKPMLLEPEKAKKIVLATVYLHNFLRTSTSSRIFYTPRGSIDTEDNGKMIPGGWRNNNEASLLKSLQVTGRRSGKNDKEKRFHLARHFVTNMTIPWQNNY